VRNFNFFTWTAVAALLLGSAGASRADVVVKDGETVAFLGDSITAGGVSSPVGYVNLVASALKTNDIKIKVVPAGVSGHKSNDMLGRLDHDVIAKKPDWMLVSCGVNDVWHGDNGVPLEKYKTNMTAIVDKAQATGIKVMILTATVIGEDVANPNNKKLIDYNAFLRELAKQKNCLLADLNADFLGVLNDATKAGNKPGSMLTADGVHPNARGHFLMAKGILRAFGMDEKQLDKAENVWLDIPGGVNFDVWKSLTVRQYRQLEVIAAKQHKEVSALTSQLFSKAIDDLLAQKANDDAAATMPAK